MEEILVFLWILSGVACVFCESVTCGLIFIGVSVLLGLESLSKDLIKYRR